MKKYLLITLIISLCCFYHANLTFADAPTDPKDVKPLAVGELIANASLKTPKNKTTNLFEVITKPTVLIFYRGGWCPYCNRHLGELQSIEKQLLSLGYQIIAISPDRPEKLKMVIEKNSLNYNLYSDSTGELITAFRLAFKLDDETFKLYKEKYNIDIEADSGYKHHLLPVPAVYLIDQNHKILFEYHNPDYKIRFSANELLEAAKKYQGK